MSRLKSSRALELALASHCAYPDSREPVDELELDSVHTFGAAPVAGFVGSTGKRVILAFRGSTYSPSESDTLTWLDNVFTDWTANLRLEPKQFHSGQVQGTYLELVRGAWPAIRELLADHGAKNKKLWITGHSMGGALAALAGALAHWEGGMEVAGVYTFGAPKIGDEAFARHYPVPLFRFENRNDIIPHLPPPIEVAKLLRVLSPDIEDALSRWFGPHFLDFAFTPLGALQYLDRKSKIREDVAENERLVALVSAMVLDRGQLLQDHWIDSYCAAIEASL